MPVSPDAGETSEGDEGETMTQEDAVMLALERLVSVRARTHGLPRQELREIARELIAALKVKP